ncbi:biopolymer transporter ExbD [Gemmata sp. JC717]|uniref:Biopolymer transporter ExbD n=1 Tax=Gemmata algarum TaxID=2975278 RepID=A0ABU5F0E8_9BACT|nr:biopolymer transporter ExbD [Gemmata algarum]MDY3555779.1 biopolymer transporter ExbD [Gemmata algarum]MDY3559391.1 biopolymer transporter ExbD [Gemmata algarum]
MSHGSSDKCEPNFTPLLDLVLQLVMFFMLCANFVMDQTNVDIKLPLATTAKAIEATEPYVLYLNVNEKGQVIYPPGALGKDGESSDNPVQLAIWLKRRADEDRLIAGPGNEDKPLRTLIVLRVHKACPFEKTYPVMKACRSAGYQRVQLRAILAGSGPG